MNKKVYINQQLFKGKRMKYEVLTKAMEYVMCVLNDNKD